MATMLLLLWGEHMYAESSVAVHSCGGVALLTGGVAGLPHSSRASWYSPGYAHGEAVCIESTLLFPYPCRLERTEEAEEKEEKRR